MFCPVRFIKNDTKMESSKNNILAEEVVNNFYNLLPISKKENS